MAIEILSFGSLTSWIVLIGVLVGLAARTLLPYWDKAKTGEIEIFDKKFLGTAVIAFIAAIIPAFAFFPIAMEQIGPYLGTFGIPAVFILSALIGYGANDIVNYGLKTSQKAANIQALEKKIESIVDQKVTEKINQIKEKDNK